MKRAKLLAVVFLTVCSALCAGGCIVLAIGAGAGLGIGAYKFVKGELEVAYPAGYEETWSAALDALDSLELTKRSASKDAFGGRIGAARADGTPVKMSVTPVTPDSTTVKIRVGAFGNRAMSETIASEIEAILKK
jgi:hypothetical protein